MRLLSLDLEAYGPFTGRSLSFRPDARLHVVLGPNEAGKSSALSAVTDLLFGIEARTRHAFVHEMPNLRIGAEIEDREGRRLAFRRRKGNRNTLIDAADRALPDDALAPFLGGLTREVFRHAFGLGSEELREGGEEMMRSEGEIGASLTAAASGLRGYAALQKGLESEADAIFGPRASRDRIFYQALRRYEDARRAAAESTLRDGPWRALNESIAASGALLDGLKAERGTRAAERARLERLKRVGPLVAAIDALAGRAEADTALAGLPDGLGDAWIDGLERRIAAEGTSAKAERESEAALVEAARAFEAVGVDEPLLARADAITDAYRGIDRFEKDGDDLPRVADQEAGFARTLADLAARIGVAPDALRDRQPPDPVRARIEGLIASGRDIAGDLARFAQELERRNEDAARLARGEAGAAPALDPAPLRLDLKTFAPLKADLLRLDAHEEAIRRQAEPVLAQAARLFPPVADIAALERSPLPSHETIARFRRDGERLEREREKARDAMLLAGRTVAETRERLRRREGGRPIRTQEDLTALRAERDGLLAALRPSLLSGEAAPGDLLPRFETAMTAADRAADDLAADAERAAEHAADLRKLALGEETARTAGIAAEAAEERSEAAARDWRGAWDGAGILPTHPAEMAVWRTEVDALIEAQQAVAAERRNHAALAARIESRRVPLLDLSRRAGLADLDGLDVGSILDRIEMRLTALADAWEAARAAQGAIRAAAEQVARTEGDIAEARARQAAWASLWADAVAAIGLPGTATPEEAASALAAWSAVPNALGERDNRRSRADGIRRDRDAYLRKVARVTEGLDPELSALPPEAAVKTLHARLRAAIGDATRRDELGRFRDAAQAAHAAAVAAAEAARRDLADHLLAAGPAAAAFAPADLHERLSARRTLRAELALRRDALARNADGLPEAALREELGAVPADEIEAALARLAVEEEEAVERGQRTHAERDACERQRLQLETGMGSELALAQRKAAEAEMAAAARDWAVLRIAGLMLGSAIGRHRAGQQDPLVARAGVLFSGLTGGAFAGLAQDYDEADSPRIAGRRASGGTITVEEMSEGTRDQLYLALRLAYLEDYATRSEPAPFVGDDLFLTFDDARTGHGIEALASLGGAIQPILFTHHAHVAEIARARLGGAVEVLAL